MMKHKELMTKEIVKEAGSSIGGISKISGATHSDGSNCDFDQGKRDFSAVECKPGEQKSDSSVKKVAGFVAFSADYHGPKRHPPKHN